MLSKKSRLLPLVFAVSNYAYGFEHTKVLPKGIRNLTLKNAQTQIGRKTNKNGIAEPLAAPLQKNLDFEKVVNGEKGFKQQSIKSLMIAEGFSNSDSLGVLRADLKGSVSVFAPIFSYGLSDQFTLAMAVPYYRAKTDVSVGFDVNRDLANRFVGRLRDKNTLNEANEVVDKLNHAHRELNTKLDKNGYRALKEWEGKGLGDVMLAGKYRALDGSVLKMANFSGVNLPTGRTSDPDILNDIPFGKGAYNLFTSFIFDEYVTPNFFFNQYGKYSHYLPGNGKKRLVTEKEAIEVATENVEFQLGDTWEFGTSMQYETQGGMVSGLGLVYTKKFSDSYDTSLDQEVRSKLEKDTSADLRQLEVKVGYSGVNAYKRGELPAPVAITLDYKRHLASLNTTTNDLVTLDVSLFF